MIAHAGFSSGIMLIMLRREFLRVTLTAPVLGAADASRTVDWPAFRGPAHSGVATGFRTPSTWNAEAAQPTAILWKIPIPGLGHASPIVWGDLILIATAVRTSGQAPLRLGLYGDSTAADDSAEQKWMLCAYDKRSGRERWSRVVRQARPRAQRHMKATHANATPATDGEIVVVFFGSEGLHCFDLDGKLRWTKDLGTINVSKYGIGWGFAASPALHGDSVFVQCDAPGDPYLAALRKSDGAELWRISRKDVCERSWSTPFVHAQGAGAQVVANGWPHVVSYDAGNGRERWRLRGGGDNPIPTPFAYQGLIYVASAHGGPSPVYAIRPSARGDITPAEGATSSEHIVWSAPRNGAYIQTPLAYDGLIYSGTNNGILKCYDAATGEKHYEQRVKDSDAAISASPVAADGKVYWTSESGVVYVVRAGRRFELLAANPLGEDAMATPAISEGVLYFRTLGQLIAVGARA